MREVQKYNLYLKMILIIYIIGSNIININLYTLVMYTLIYLIINISYMIFYKDILIVISAIVSLIAFREGISYSIVLYSFSVVELLTKSNKNRYIYYIFILIPALKMSSNVLEYLLLSSIIILFMKLYKTHVISTYTSEEQLEKKRKQIKELSYKIQRSQDSIKQHIYTTKLEERNNLSKEIHDKVGHTISGSLMQLEAVKIVMNKDIDKSKEMVDNTIKVLRNGMEDIRKVLKEINISDEQIGINKIKLLLNEKLKNTDFEFNILHSGVLENISKLHWVCIYECIREASTNSIKYSNGNKININIEVLNKLIKVEIKDNGIGCDKVNKSIGLNNIEQRVVDLDGKLVINSENGFGLILLLPYIN